MTRRPLDPRPAPRRRPGVQAGAVPAATLRESFPPIDLPIRPPFPPMEARLVDEIPAGPGWLYEPKWDGFRCLAFKSAGCVLLQSKSGQPLGRFFPELVEGLLKFGPREFVMDGEIVVVSCDGRLSFDDLLQRIHPAESRIRKLSVETPAQLIAFDLLVDARREPLVTLPLACRRERLESLFSRGASDPFVSLSPVSPERSDAIRWLKELDAAGLDGIVAKLTGVPYASGDRTGMVKVKRVRTADCVVGGFHYQERGREIGSLLLGLFDAQGLLHHVGFTSSFSVEDRRALRPMVEARVEPPGFTGHAPGGPSRWSTKRSLEWQPVRNELVCEVKYDHFSGDRFRHGTQFLRWRPDKSLKDCTFDQVRATGSPDAMRKLLSGG